MRLNKTQQYAIRWMVSQGNEIAQIVKELKIPADSVNRFVEKNCNINTNNTIPTTSSRVKAKDLMIRNTSSKQINNVAIMTREASEMGDHFKKSAPNTQSAPRYENNIHRIYDK